MKKAVKPILSVLLALVMALALLPASVQTAEAASSTTLRVGVGQMTGEFSIYAEVLGDTTVWGLTQATLLTSDRTGMPVLKGIDGTTRAYNGINYTYTGISDLTVTEQSSGAVYYDFTLRSDVYFSDGKKLTADDVIFSMYVLSDPSYASRSTFSSLPIRGMDDYISGDAASISGIRKLGTYKVRVIMTEIDASALYNMNIAVMPLHYYGETAKYDYDNNRFGFTKGDVSHVRAKSDTPMGAGPYKFTKYEDGVVTMTANSKYYKGEPKAKYLKLRYTSDCLGDLLNDNMDIVDPALTADLVSAIKSANSNGQLTGSKITTCLLDNLGYGYIGQNAVNVKVGSDAGSAKSRNLRKAFATLFAVYRREVIDSYYGDRADVIEYPISDTSWAAPQPGDAGYREAFSVDVNGNPIYTAGMTKQQRYDAALQAALGYFQAAGYTVKNGKLTAAPSGAKLAYTIWIPGGGYGDHPSYGIVSKASAALAKIGMTLNINDLSNSSDLWNGLDSLQVEMWAAAWGSAVDPDMYQIYYSDVANGPTSGDNRNPLGGPAQGGSNYEYCIADKTLDAKILAARQTTDMAKRKTIYKECLDIVMDWAVETPVYQRQYGILFATQRVNMATVTPDQTPFYSWMNEIEKVELGATTFAVTGQPINASGCVDDNACFRVCAAGVGLKYQWQYKAAGGTSWNTCSMSGSKTDTLTVPVTAARNGYQYRCKITDSAGTIKYSSAAKLTVKTRITAQPAGKTLPIGDTAKFTVKATGVDLTYQWQYKTAGGTSWNTCSMTGNKTATLSVPVTAARNGYKYRCKITDGNGKTTYSSYATLKVKTVVTTQPADKNLSVGSTAKFTVKATGVDLTYQWQYKTAGGTGWNTCSMTGNKTATLSVPVTDARNGYQYRCKITDGNGKVTYSNAAALTVKTKITAQPENVTASVGTTAKFTVKATGAGLKYQWQYKTAGGTGWNTCSMTGSKTATLSVPVTDARNGYQYRCKITDANGKVTYSNAAALTVA